MPTYQDFVQELENFRQTKEDLLAKQLALRFEADTVGRKLRAARRGVASQFIPNLSQLTAEWEAQQNQLLKSRNEVLAVQQKLEATVQDLLHQTNDPLVELDDKVPILLLPLRLEIRYAEHGKQLWVRIFPDDIAVHHHDQALTAQEVLAGAGYWKSRWEVRSEPDVPKEDTRRKAWSLVVNLFGVNRGNWIIRETKPLKLGTDDIFPGNFLEIDLAPKALVKKEYAWNRPSRCLVMPDFLKIKLYFNETGELEFLGNPIPNSLQIGPDPMEGGPSQPDPEKSWAGTPAYWMEDFDEAIRIGMGFKIDLDALNLAGQAFSKILVFGVKSLYPQAGVEGRQRLEELFENHQYSPDGMGFLPQGTPTNNSDESDAGFVRADAYSEQHYQLEMEAPGKSSHYQSDSQILARLLNVDHAIFAKLENAHWKDFQEAKCMNSALYPATLGYFTQYLLHPVFTENDLNELHRFFTEYVTGRGPLPAIRVGRQPYGFLVTSDFNKWKYTPPSSPNSFYDALYQILSKLSDAWKKMVKDEVKASFSTPDASENLDQVLSLHAASVQFWQRIAFGENISGNQHRNPKLISLINEVFDQLSKNYGIPIPDTSFLPEGILQLSKLSFENQSFPLDPACMVDTRALSEIYPVQGDQANPTDPPKPNYLNWLQHQFLRNTVKDRSPLLDDYFKNTDKLSQAPLLYLFLRHALLLQLTKCTWHWLKEKGYLPTQPSELSLLSKSDWIKPGTIYHNFIAGKELYNVNRSDILPAYLLNIAVGNRAFKMKPPPYYLVEYLVQERANIEKALGNSQPRKEFQRLIDFFDSLQELENLPSARLELCFVEHLDSLSYRLDTWQTGLFYQKLEQLRQPATGKGIYLGAYGWLENIAPSVQTPVDVQSIDALLRPAIKGPVLQSNEPGGFIHAPSLAQAKTGAVLRNAFLNYKDNNTPELMAVNLSSSRIRDALYLVDGIQKGLEIGALLGYQFERGMHDKGLDLLIPAYREKFKLKKAPLFNKTTSDKTQGDLLKPELTDPEYNDNTTVTNGLSLIQCAKIQPFGFDLADILLYFLPDDLRPEDMEGDPREPDILNAAWGAAGAIKLLVEQLIDNVDALKDLLVTESIHQLVQGNYDRAGAVLKSVGSDLTPPPVIESVYTPRRAETTVTHRVCILFDTTAAPGTTPMSRLEPGLNKWLGERMGPLSEIGCLVEHEVEHVNTDKTVENRLVLFSELGLEPIDLIYLASKDINDHKVQLQSLIAYVYRTTGPDEPLADNIPVKIHFDAAPGKKTLPDVWPLWSRLKSLIGSARPMHAEDVDLTANSGKSNSKNYTVNEIFYEVDNREESGGLLARSHFEITALNKILLDLNSYITSEPAQLKADTILADVRETLLKTSKYNFSNAIPTSASGAGEAEKKLLGEQVIRVIRQVKKRLDDASSSKGRLWPEPRPEINERVDILSDSIRKLMGGDFKVLPYFTFSGDDSKGQVDRSSTLQTTYTSGPQLFNFIQQKTGLASRRLHLQNWFDGVAKVQPRIQNLEWVRTMTAGDHLDFHVLQLPYQSGDSWLGLEFPENESTHQNKLSILLHHPDEVFDADKQSWCGLVVDDWMESIPGKEELTGLALNHTQPNSQPPQALLLAVAPENTGSWSAEILENILNDTLERAHQRAVSPENIVKTDWAGLIPTVLSEIIGSSGSKDSPSARSNVALNLSLNNLNALL